MEVTIFTVHAPDKGIVVIIYEELMSLNNGKASNPIKRKGTKMLFKRGCTINQ
jgi:hypothetical protein